MTILSCDTPFACPHAGAVDDSEVVVLDEDGGVAGTHQQPLYNQRPAARLAAKPANKQGGWGQGEMAQAGTLMVGDDELDELDRLAPTLAPGATVSPTAAQVRRVDRWLGDQPCTILECST